MRPWRAIQAQRSNDQDLDGLKKLQAMLQKYQGILEMMEPNEE
jgi:hypothetical protein